MNIVVYTFFVSSFLFLEKDYTLKNMYTYLPIPYIYLIFLITNLFLLKIVTRDVRHALKGMKMELLCVQMPNEFN